MEQENGKPFRITTFKHAFEGIATAVRVEPNMKIHILVALLVVVLGFYVQLNSSDWVKIIALIGLVFSLELTNTAIEEIVDSLTNEQHPGAKKAKDTAAGAVLVASVTAIIGGVLIFLPYLV